MTYSPVVADVWILYRIDIYGGAVGVFGPVFASCGTATVEGRSVIRLDRVEIGSLVVAHESHFVDGVAYLVECGEDIEYFVGHAFVYYHLSHLSFAVKIPVWDTQISQILRGYGASSPP